MNYWKVSKRKILKEKVEKRIRSWLLYFWNLKGEGLLDVNED